MLDTNHGHADAWKRGFEKTCGISYEACLLDLEKPDSVKKLNETADNSRKVKREGPNKESQKVADLLEEGSDNLAIELYRGKND
jgi:hypothetical protein